MENPALSLRNEYLSFSLNGELYGIVADIERLVMTREGSAQLA